MENISKCWYESVCGLYNDHCQPGCVRYAEMKYLMTNSNLPASRQMPQILEAPEVDLESYRHLADIKANIVDFVTNGENLYICGSTPGTGKTSWAIKLMLAYFNQIWDGNGLRERGLFIPVTWFLLKCKDFKRTDYAFEDIKELLMKVDLVIWDDIGHSNLSDYDYTNLLMYIDYRRNNCMANIFTGNITSKQDLRDTLGSKIADRVWSGSTDVVEFKSRESRR